MTRMLNQSNESPGLSAIEILTQNQLYWQFLGSTRDLEIRQ